MRIGGVDVVDSQAWYVVSGTWYVKTMNNAGLAGFARTTYHVPRRTSSAAAKPLSAALPDPPARRISPRHGATAFRACRECSERGS